MGAGHVRVFDPQVDGVDGGDFHESSKAVSFSRVLPGGEWPNLLPAWHFLLTIDYLWWLAPVSDRAFTVATSTGAPPCRLLSSAASMKA